MAEENKMKNEGEHINLKVAGQDGTEVHFKIKRSTPLRKLMEAYCQRSGLRLTDVRFVSPEGQRIQPEQTPVELELEDGDSIDVMHQQTGGC